MVDLENIELIKQLKARYFRGLDILDLELLQSVFVADATVEFHSSRYDFEMEGWPDLEAFFTEQFTENRFGLHQAHTPEISVDGSTAEGLWYLHDVFIDLENETRTEGSAIYEDRYIKTNGEWHIEHMYYDRRLEAVTSLDESFEVTSRPIS